MKLKSIEQSLKDNSISDFILDITVLLIIVTTLIGTIRHFILGNFMSILTIVVVNILLLLLACIIRKTRIPMLMVFVGLLLFIFFYLTNYFYANSVNIEYLIASIFSVISAVVGGYFSVKNNVRPRKPSVISIVCILVITLTVSLIWVVNTTYANKKLFAEHEMWAVPDKFDNLESNEKGIIEKITYKTFAYATDLRKVNKDAYVYLPYDYDEEKQYNILYLMHGTGDDETSWLIMHEENKIMIDNLIYYSVIEPMIIVTPTFYVEDDCLDHLDTLTYSFEKELRNDLIPFVESNYSTYAKTTNEMDIIDSRNHRAFAGLSRGAVTMYHSAFCGSLDYFSSFGAFSGNRTEAKDYLNTIQSDEFIHYSIDYLYVSAGNFDFALADQISGYDELLDIEGRLNAGENTRFDVFPMKYHSFENWHLALYNYLQVVFNYL